MNINIHNHIFGRGAIPNKFLGFVTPILKIPIINTLLSSILRKIPHFIDGDELDKYAQFLKTSDKKQQSDIYNELKSQYPDDWKFVILPMDMAFCERGKVPEDYEEQLEDLYDIFKLNNTCIPFVMIDPNRPNCFGVFKNAIEQLHFKGLKLYCNLGYYPTDERLLPIYNYCNEHNLSIITHCTPNNPVFYNGSKEQLKQRLGLKELPFKKFRDNIQLFGQPNNYEILLKNYPSINICFAHFGGSDSILEYLQNKKIQNWHTDILRLIEIYPNAYTDISYTLFESSLLPYIKQLMDNDHYKNKILFGSDFYMNQTVGQEFYCLNDYKNSIGIQSFYQQSVLNNNKFLNL